MRDTDMATDRAVVPESTRPTGKPMFTGSAILVVLLVGLYLVGCNTESREERLDRLLEPYDVEGAPGIAVAVLEGNKRRVTRTLGLADLELGTPIESSTNFRLASVTKQFTAAAILLLVNRGDLELSSTLAEIFDGFPSYGKDVQIQHLLTHTSGLVDYESVMPRGQERPILDAGVLELMMAQDSTYFTPGSQYQYSNTAYAVLAQVVEQKTDQSFAAFLKEHIFVPAGMGHSVAFESGISDVSSRAFGYSFIEDQYLRTDQSKTSSVLGDGGIYSSLDDLERWYHSFSTGLILPRQMVDDATTKQTGTDHGEGAGYGYGWFIETHSGHTNVRHSGSTIGFRNDVEHFPDSGLTVIVLSNRNDLDAQDLARSVADVFLRP